MTKTTSLGMTKCLELARAVKAMRETVAAQHKGWTAPLSAEQINSVNRMDAYTTARNQLQRTWSVSDNDLEEISMVAKHLGVAEEIATETRLRPITSPKGLAKAVRERLAGKDSKPVKLITDREELDRAELDGIAALKRLHTSKATGRVVTVVREAFKADPEFWHNFIVEALENHRQEINVLMGNKRGWAEPKGGFLKRMTAAELLKTDDLEAIAAEQAAKARRAAIETVMADRTPAEERRFQAMRARAEKKAAQEAARRAAKKAK